MYFLRSLWPFAVILTAYGLDRFSKWWAADYFTQNGTTELHPLLTLREAYNRGIAFGMLQGVGPVVGWLTVIVVVALTIFMLRLPAGDYLMKLGLATLIGGAAGNMWDRIVHGEVLDFIATPIRPGIFNLADVFIYVGIAICFIAAFWPAPTAPEIGLPIDSPLE